MKKNLEKRLAKFGLSLISTRFGLHGDWMVEGSDGSVAVFTTLGRVRELVEDIENGGVSDYIPGYDDGEAA